MTARKLYEAVLIELNKSNAPNIMLEDFNYWINKAIQQYVNKRYNIYDISQQTTDDLRVLKATATLDVVKTPYNEKILDGTDFSGFMFMGATYTAELPQDYYHLLNCMCFYKVNNTYSCYDKGTVARAAATRLTADSWSQVVDNYWNRPTYKHPYYYIHNVNTSKNTPTNPADTNIGNITNTGTDKPYQNLLGNVSDLSQVELNESEIGMINQNTDKTQEMQNTTYNGLLPSSLSRTTTETTKSIVKKPVSVNNIVAIGTSVKDLPKVQVGDFALTDNEGLLKGVTNANGIDKWEKTEAKEGEYYRYNNKTYKVDNTLRLIELRENSSKTDTQYQNMEKLDDPFKTIDINGFIRTPDGKYPQRNSQVRYGNASKVLLEIRYGEDTSTFELFKIMVDYIKAPQHIRLTQEQIDRTLDYSQVLEFPDYVCQEIVNELVTIIMENISDQRLQTHPVVSQSIANPAQQQTPDAATTAK